MNREMQKMGRMLKVAYLVLAVAFLGVTATAFSQTAEPAVAAEAAVAVASQPGDIAAAARYIAIAIIMFGGSLAASLAVGKIGAAAMGAAAEKPELLGKAIAFVGLGEGIALFGFIIALMIKGL